MKIDTPAPHQPHTLMCMYTYPPLPWLTHIHTILAFIKDQQISNVGVHQNRLGGGWDELGDQNLHLYTIDTMHKIDN